MPQTFVYGTKVTGRGNGSERWQTDWKVALFALATEAPRMILAQVLVGISRTNAITWAAFVARDWSGFIPCRPAPELTLAL